MKYINYALIIAVALSFTTQSIEAKMSKEAHNLYQQACALEYKRNYTQAIEIMQKAIEINGDDAMLYTKIAGLYAERGDYNSALEAYNKALKIQPNDAFIYISVGGLYQNMQDYKAAFEAYNKAMTIFPSYKYNYLNMANVKYISKDYKKAIEYYDSFLAAYPEHIEANENLANSYLAIDKSEKACEIYARLLKNNAENFKDYFRYGIALFNTKKYEEAIPMLKQAIENDPSNTLAWADLALCYQNTGENEFALASFKKTFDLNPNLTALKFDYANLLGNMGLNEDAVIAYKEYTEAFPDDANAFKNLGLVYKALNKNELALLNLEKSYLKDPANTETQKLLARYYHEEKDFQKALKYYDLVLQHSPEDFDAKANKALVLHAQKNFPTAIDMYKDLLLVKENGRISKNLVSAQIAYGYYLLDRLDYSQATLYFKDALREAPEEASAYFGLAEASRHMGLNELALENYAIAIEKEPDNTTYYNALNDFKATIDPKEDEEVTEAEEVEQTQTTPSEQNEEVKKEAEENTDSTEEAPANLGYEGLIQKGYDFYQKGQYNEAIDFYSKAIILKPDDAVTMLKIGNIHNLLGNTEKATLFYEHATESNQEYADAWFNLGLTYAHAKRHKDCIKCFEKVIKLTPNYPYSYYALGLAYEAMGDNFNAIENYTLYKGFEADEKMLETIEAKIKALEN